MASATPTTVEAYLTAAQAGLSSGDYAEARKQTLLAEMELAKLPLSHGQDGCVTQYRTQIQGIIKALNDLEARDGTRRSAVGVYGAEPW